MNTGEKASAMKLFEGYGIEISTMDGKYYIRYYVDRYIVVEVSEKDARRAQISKEDAYQVLIQYHDWK